MSIHYAFTLICVFNCKAIHWHCQQLLNIDNGKILLHGNTQYIKLPDNFCNILATKYALIESIFPDLRTNYINHAWLREQAIMAAKSIDVDAINLKIRVIAWQ